MSTADQTAENQLLELRRYSEARGWTCEEYVDHGVSGARRRRPALDRMLGDAETGRVDVVLVAKLDRLGRSVVDLYDIVKKLGVPLVSAGDGFDLTTSNGRLLFGILATIAAFERDLIVERTKAGLARAKAEGKTLGRPRTLSDEALESVSHLSVRAAARALGVDRGVVAHARRADRLLQDVAR